MKVSKGLILACLLIGFFVWLAPLRTQDGPNHRKIAVYLAQYDDTPALQEVYQDALSLVRTNVLFPALYKPWHKIVSIRSYEKVFFALSLILLLICYHYFLSVWAPAQSPLWVLILPFLLHPLFIRGMYNYLASIPLTLLALTFLRAGLDSRKISYWFAYTVCVYLGFLAHPFPGFVLAICLALLAIGQYRTRLLWVMAYAVPIVVMLGVGFLMPLLTTSMAGADAMIFKPPWELVAGLTFYNFTGYSLVPWLVILTYLVLLIALMGWSAKSTPWHDKIFWIAMLAGYFIFPNERGAGAHLNERFLPYVWLFLPLGLTLSVRRVRQVQMISIGIAVIVTANVLWGMYRVEALAQQADTVLEEVPDGARLYPIIFDPMGPAFTYSSLMHLWAHYDDDKTVYSPSLFAASDMMPLHLRRPPDDGYFPALPENFAEQIAKGQRPEDWSQLFAPVRYYDYWFVYAPPAAFLAWAAGISGLEKVSESGASSLWHYNKALAFQPPLPR